MHPKQSFVDPLTPRKKHERHINTQKMLIYHKYDTVGPPDVKNIRWPTLD